MITLYTIREKGTDNILTINEVPIMQSDKEEAYNALIRIAEALEEVTIEKFEVAKLVEEI